MNKKEDISVTKDDLSTGSAAAAIYNKPNAHLIRCQYRRDSHRSARGSNEATMTEPDFIRSKKKSTMSLNGGNENERPQKQRKKKNKKSLCADCDSLLHQIEL